MSAARPVTVLDLRHALQCDRTGCACRRPRAAVHCPHHPDRRPSLSLAEREGVLLVHCFSGCEQRAVIAALRARGLWPGAGASPPSAPRSWLEPILTEERRRLARLAPFRVPWRLLDEARRYRQAARVVRGGVEEDGEADWALEAEATRLDRAADRLEALADARLQHDAARRPGAL